MAFNDTNLIPAFTDNRWSVVSGTASLGSEIITTPMSSVKLIVNDSVSLSNGTKFKIKAVFSDNSGIDNEYTPKLFIRVNIVYSDNTCDYFILTFNEKYRTADSNSDETTFDTQDKTISSMSIVIYNKSTDITQHITNLFMYKDMSVNQTEINNKINETVNNSLSNLASYTFPVYWSDEAHSNFVIGAIIEGTKEQVLFKPIYEDGIVTSIITNVGITFSIPNYIGDPFE